MDQNPPLSFRFTMFPACLVAAALRVPADSILSISFCRPKKTTNSPEQNEKPGMTPSALIYLAQSLKGALLKLSAGSRFAETPVESSGFAR